MTSHKYINKGYGGPLRSDLYSCSHPSLKSGTLTVPFTVSICLVLLAGTMNMILHYPPEQFVSSMVLYLVFYLGIIVSFPLGETDRMAPRTRTAIWACTTVLITLAIIAISFL